jgi:UDP-N-acetylglucosamine diphosphorylase/glucosamine-1-phosphate N-acetyltransferase
MKHDSTHVSAVILAAGMGKRMKSDLPKVLHAVGERPMLLHVIDAVKAVGAAPIVVITGYQAERVEAVCAGTGVIFARQDQQLGTGHAVMQAEPALAALGGTVVVLNGDVPGLRPQTIRAFIAHHDGEHAVATVLTAMLDDPTGYGRIVRDANGNLLRIVEEKDASESERAIREINSGLFCFETAELFPALKRVDRRNSQNEYYITDVIGYLAAEGKRVVAWCIDDAREVAGVNNPDELDAVRRFVDDQP